MLDATAVACTLRPVTRSAQRLISLREAIVPQPAVYLTAASVAEQFFAVLSAVPVDVVDGQVLGRPAAGTDQAVMLEDLLAQSEQKTPLSFFTALRRTGTGTHLSAGVNRAGAYIAACRRRMSLNTAPVTLAPAFRGALTDPVLVARPD